MHMDCCRQLDFKWVYFQCYVSTSKIRNKRLSAREALSGAAHVARASPPLSLERAPSLLRERSYGCIAPAHIAGRRDRSLIIKTVGGSAENAFRTFEGLALSGRASLFRGHKELAIAEHALTALARPVQV